MKLTGPIETYLRGSNRTHCARKWLADAVGTTDENLSKILSSQGFVDSNGKTTALAAQSGLVDSCEGKLIWNIALVRKSLGIDKTSGKPSTVSTTSEKDSSPFAFQRRKNERELAANNGEPRWVDLDVIATYFGVSKVKIGSWLDALGMREYPVMERNSSGDFDLLDVARKAQQEQAVGRSGKKPTEKALESGLAKILVVTNRKDQEIELTKWNLDLTKEVLVRAGHSLDTNRSGALKGKGKNSNVAVNGIDQRAKELYIKWARLYADPKTQWQCKKLFAGQPKPILEAVEKLMKMPGYLTEGRYLKE